MIKSLNLETVFTQLNFYDRFEQARNAGFEVVEFWSWDDKNLDKIKDLCTQYNLSISGFSGDKDYSIIDLDHSAKYIEYVEQSIEAAKFLNCKNLIIHSNALGDGGVVVNHYTEKTFSEKISAMAIVLLKLAPIAQRAGITLNMEALNTQLDHVGNFLEYTSDAVSVVKAVNSQNVKILYDIYHMQLNEGKIINTIKKYIDYIGYVHVADVPGRAEPGTGEINYANVFKAFKETNYGGTIGFELFPSIEDHMAVAKQLVKLF